MSPDAGDLARSYYETIDDGDYDALRALLADDFVQERPDRTLEGADRFVRFMREERPETDTTHVVDRIYRADATDRAGEDGGGADPGAAGPTGVADADLYVAAEGRLDRANGETWFRFVDTFAVVGGRLATLTTYTMTM